jgi:phosphate transport system protein
MGLHTSRAYEQELSDLKARILAMGGRCEQLIQMASKALDKRDADLAHKVEQTDRAINVEEMAIDQMTVRILALRQPVGRDLRFLVTALKVVTDLERIGDEAVNIAERAAELAAEEPIAPHLTSQLHDVANAAGAMVRSALDSFVKEDAEAARAVLEADDYVDEKYGTLLRASMQYIRENPERVNDGWRYASCAKYLERVADHATNIAEMVIFMVSGDDVRHHSSANATESVAGALAPEHDD